MNFVEKSPYRSLSVLDVSNKEKMKTISSLRRKALVRALIRNIIPLRLYAFVVVFMSNMIIAPKALLLIPKTIYLWFYCGILKTYNYRKYKTFKEKKPKNIVRAHPLIAKLDVPSYKKGSVKMSDYSWKGHFGIFPELPELLEVFRGEFFLDAQPLFITLFHLAIVFVIFCILKN